MKLFNILILTILVLIGSNVKAQDAFSSFHYQGYISQENSDLHNASQTIVISLYQGVNKDVLLYEEEQTIEVNQYGYFSANVGLGDDTNTALERQLSDVQFQENKFYYLNVTINNIAIDYVRIMATPFSFVSKKTLQEYALNELLDVDTSGIEINDVLKWDGAKWVPQKDDLYDTIPFADTAFYAFKSDSSNFADTASVALFSKDAWMKVGNAGTDPALNFIGTTDNNHLHFVTNNTRRLSILNDGKIGLGIDNPLTDFHLVGDNGFLYEGTHGTGLIPYEGEGTRMMWYPAKSAFRIGTLEAGQSNYWDDARIGEYTFATGKNTIAQGNYSVSFGELSQAYATHSLVAGYASVASAGADYSMAVGHSSTTAAPYAVALGRGNNARGEASFALGYHITTRGDYSNGFGFFSQANGDYSTAMGFKAIADHDGSFIYADNSDNNQTFTTASNQFMVRAAGGTIFYTAADLSTGVQLTSGSGSWASLSDSTAKTDIVPVDYNSILNRIRSLNVYEWSYKSEPGVRHIGPMAQSFYSLFELGADNKHITTVDMDGVNLAGVKALYLKSLTIEESLADYQELLKKYEALENEKLELEKRIEKIEKSLHQK